MKKERLKSAALALLVISALILTMQIWSITQPWSEKYNFFENLRISVSDSFSSLLGIKGSDGEHAQASLISPSYLAAYTVKDMDHAICVLNEASELYETTNDYVTNVISYALTRDSKNILRVDEASWQTALFTRGLYVDYGVNYRLSTFSQLLGSASSPLEENVDSVKRFIITSEDSIVSDVSVYVSDETNNTFYKISTGLSKNDLNTTLSDLANDATVKKRFSFFINADAPASAGEAIFAPYMILDEEKSEFQSLSSSNPVIKDSGVNINMYVLDKILKAFSINSKTVSKAVESDGSIIYIQNYATLRISSDGCLSYATTASDKAPSITGNGISHSNSNAALLSDSARLAENITGSVLDTEYTKLYLSGLEENGNSLIATFDYLYAGTPIVYCGSYEGEHAVTVEFENGYLKSYKQILRRYENSDETTLCPSTYDAVNSIFDSLEEHENTGMIEKLLIAYADNGTSGKKDASWFLKFENSQNYITSK